MAEIVTMLALSPTMEEGRLVAWSKEVGDAVEEGEIIAEVETDKANMDMESFFEGTLLKLLVEPGSDVKVGDPIAIIGEEGEDISGLLDGGGQAAEPEEADADEADEATQEPDEADEADEAKEADPAPDRDGDRIFSSPVARKMASEHGIALAAIEGSGPRGRVVKRDVEAAIEAAEQEAAKPSTPKKKAAALEPTSSEPADGGEQVSLSPMRKAIARRMTESWTTAPHFTLTTEIDMGEVMALRKSMNNKLAAAEAGLKLSVNDFILKACALALREVPAMNVAWGGDHVVQYDEVHIGVAVAIDGGLITPVVRHADKLTLGQISSTVRDLAGRARDKRLKPDEYTGSTFSVSNLGMFGVTQFQAVLNPPEAGILAVGAVVQKPVVQDGAIVVGTRMEVTLSCDHRSSDGAVGATLLQAIKRLLENPVLLTV
ncbi:MAG: pyruvate dehydrogenase complex dihydrolipoamide acetyltransferase [Myxococcales bacterium]|nr:pyruvate dehydrogenase complex dihydrolipoamide acetyltransferase [Myxococcales bacterium]